MDNQKLPMRIGVGIILLNNKNQVFVGNEKIILEINGKCLKVVLKMVKIFLQL